MKIGGKINTIQSINILLFVCEHCWRTEGTLNCGIVRQDIIGSVIDPWRERLQTCVRANDGHDNDDNLPYLK